MSVAVPLEISCVPASVRRKTSSLDGSVLPLGTSSAVSGSFVVTAKRLPSLLGRPFALNSPLPPAGPVDRSVLRPPSQRYASAYVSVSAATRERSVVKNTRAPSWLNPSRSGREYGSAGGSTAVVERPHVLRWTVPLSLSS